MATVVKPLARTPLLAWHAAHGAQVVESEGWQLPSTYADVEQEQAAARTSLAICDVSAFSKVSLQGQAVPILTWSLAGMGGAMKPQGVSRFMANSAMLACRLAEQHLLLLASSLVVPGFEQYLANLGRTLPAIQMNVTTAYAGMWLVGPRGDELLRRLTALDVSAAGLPPDRCVETKLAQVHALLVRSSELELPSVRLYVPWELGEYVWEVLFDVGRRFDVAPMGLEALHQMLPKPPTLPGLPPGLGGLPPGLGGLPPLQPPGEPGASAP